LYFVLCTLFFVTVSDSTWDSGQSTNFKAQSTKHFVKKSSKYKALS
jgi:hypothetical protein